MSKNVGVICGITPENVESLTWDVVNDQGQFDYEDFTIGTADLEGFIEVLQAILDAKRPMEGTA